MMAALATTAMTLGELFGAAAGNLDGVQVEDLVLDSRQITPGAAFLAVQGSESHGLDHVDDALARGAVAVVYEPSASHDAVAAPSVAMPGLNTQLGELARNFFGRQAEPLTLAGVTGTNGKSTVAHLVAQAQTLRGTRCGYVGTLGSGVPPDLVSQTLTTPDCLTLHRTLRSLSVSHAAIEVSSHALAQDRIAGLEFHTAVLTNISRDHLDYHGDLHSYQEAKARLFQLPALQYAVLFVDDPFGAALTDRLARGPGGSAVVMSSLVGDFNAENLLLALGTLIAWDVPLVEACEALSECRGLAGRMQVFGGGQNEPQVIVDYAHTPAALTRVLENLDRIGGAELWCVFGCGGQRDAGKRAAMGTAAARIADHVVLTDDNPRDEDPGVIVADIRAGLAAHPDVWVEHDRRRAITDVIEKAGADDIVLVAGKGHEDSQWIAGEQRLFSDSVVVEDALGGRG